MMKTGTSADTGVDTNTGRTDGPRSRAVAAAEALLHQSAASSVAQVRCVIGEFDRWATQLRSAWKAAAAPAPAWLDPATVLMERLEEASAWWNDTGERGAATDARAGDPAKKSAAESSGESFVESSVAELGLLLCELDALAAELLTAAAPEPSAGVLPKSARPQTPPVPSVPSVPSVPRVSPRGVVVARSAALCASATSGLRLSPCSVAAVAVIGVVGGMAAAVSHAPSAALPRNPMVSVPLPFARADQKPATSTASSPGAPRGASVNAVTVPVALAAKAIPAPAQAPPPAPAAAPAPGPEPVPEPEPEPAYDGASSRPPAVHHGGATARKRPVNDPSRVEQALIAEIREAARRRAAGLRLLADYIRAESARAPASEAAYDLVDEDESAP
jgi:hypothetical protein